MGDGARPMRSTTIARDGGGWGLPASVLAHATVVVVLALTTTARLPAPDPSPVEPIDVEFVETRRPAPAAVGRSVSPAEAERPAAPSAGDPAAGGTEVRSPPPAASIETPPASTAPVAPPDDGMIRPKRLLSADVLSAAGSRRAREDLRAMAADERMVQLCDFEALEQIHAWNAAYRPETLVAHALAEVEVGDHRVTAPGAAFVSGRRWYRVEFRCEVSADLGRVTGFAFHVGTEIPRRDWRRHDLPDPGGALD